MENENSVWCSLNRFEGDKLRICINLLSLKVFKFSILDVFKTRMSGLFNKSVWFSPDNMFKTTRPEITTPSAVGQRFIESGYY